MKVIGIISDSRVLVDIEKDEIANLAGYNYASSMPKKIEVGSQFDVRSAYQQLAALSGIKKKFRDIKKGVLEAANGLDIVNDYPEIQSPERKDS